MAKRLAEDLDEDSNALKSGDRPLKPQTDEEEIDYEDEFEDEFDSEDEIFEAGVDGRPDEERELDEKRGMWQTQEALCDYLFVRTQQDWLILSQIPWMWISAHSSPVVTS